MKLPFRQKVILVLTFSVAIFVILVDLTRAAFLQHNILILLRSTHATTAGEISDIDYPCSSSSGDILLTS